MADREEFVTEVLTLMVPLGEIRTKRMFGGYGLFFDDSMFALISRNGGLFLKADEVNRDEFEMRGCKTHGKMP